MAKPSWLQRRRAVIAADIQQDLAHPGRLLRPNVRGTLTAAVGMTSQTMDRLADSAKSAFGEGAADTSPTGTYDGDMRRVGVSHEQQRNNARAFALGAYVALIGAFIAAGIAMANFSSGQVLDGVGASCFAQICTVLWLRWGYRNWLIRTRSLVGLRAYLVRPTEWFPPWS